MISSQKLVDSLYRSSIEYLVNWKKHLKEYFWAIVIVLVLRANVGVFYRIPTGSMIPTFRVGDMLVANRFYTGLKLPFTDELEGFRLPAIKELEVGDVVIFLGPREEIYYYLKIYLKNGIAENSLSISEIDSPSTSKSLGLLKELNRASKFKKVIYPVIPGSVLSNFLEGTQNYIFEDINFENRQLISIQIPERVYSQYQDEIKKYFEIVAEEVRKSTMTYEASQYKGFFFYLFSVPVAGVSMIMNVIIDTPMMIFYKGVIHFVRSVMGKEGPFYFYPNDWTDQSKEYVKRLIAKEGDKVEIKNKKVYVNDQPLEWKNNFVSDPYDPDFAISTEKMPHSSKISEDGKMFEHPIRFSESVIPVEPSLQMKQSLGLWSEELGEESRFDFLKFNPDLWPYDPEGIASIRYRDNFGPIIVPKGHYFMMGDNRDQSLDSRFFGPVPEWAVKGTPMFIFLPFDRMGIVR